MKTPESRNPVDGAWQQLRVTLGDEVRAEAKRRGAHWAANASKYAAHAEKMYGRHPLRGDDLALVFDVVFQQDGKP